MAGVTETKNGNIAQLTKLQRLTGYSNTNRKTHNMGAYSEVKNNMISAQDALDNADTALRDAKSNYVRAELAHTQLLSSGKSFEIRKNFGNNTYNKMVEQSKQNLLNLRKIQTSAQENFNNAEVTFNKIKQNFNRFKLENSKKPASPSFFSWPPWKGSGKTHKRPNHNKRHTHKRHTNKRNKTKRNRN